MANPLRTSNLKFTGSLSDGLYIVGNSKVRNLSIPHLPTIGASTLVPGIFNVAVNNENDPLTIYCPDLFDNFSDGDIIWIDSRHHLMRSILTMHANSNTLLVTEQCDNRCSFCSQPPNDLPDAELYHKATLSLLNYETKNYVGISGGEPTLNRNAFLSMLRILKTSDNKTPLHILTNGRSFSDINFVENLHQYIQGRDIVWGIPLYGHTNSIHDTLVGAKGAFIETVSGLVNLGAIGQVIELRIIPVQQNLKYLSHIVEFITDSLSFVSVISVMNLEPKGWARNNFAALTTSVKEQSFWLSKMIEIAELKGISIRLFNYPLCLLPENIRAYADQSISDWKNYFPAVCNGCDLKQNCCGFFTSATGNFIEAVEPIVWID